jgi:hypothetical protein
MKTLFFIFFLVLFGCDEGTEPIPVEKFDISGTWSNVGPNLIQFSLFILQTNESEFIADVFTNRGYIGTVDNGKIIGDERYISFSFRQQTPWGQSYMGFNGRLYKVSDQWELRGVLGGRIQLGDAWLGIYTNEEYKFVKQDFEYLFKK